jgi:hypothetical protein
MRYDMRLSQRHAITADGLREQAEQLGLLDTAEVIVLAPAAYAYHDGRLAMVELVAAQRLWSTQSYFADIADRDWSRLETVAGRSLPPCSSRLGWGGAFRRAPVCGDTDVARRVFPRNACASVPERRRNGGGDPRSVPRARSGLFRGTGRMGGAVSRRPLTAERDRPGVGSAPGRECGTGRRCGNNVRSCAPGTTNQGVVDSRACRPAWDASRPSPNPATAIHDRPSATRTACPVPVPTASDRRRIWPARACMVQPALAFN